MLHAGFNTGLELPAHSIIMPATIERFVLQFIILCFVHKRYPILSTTAIHLNYCNFKYKQINIDTILTK